MNLRGITVCTTYRKPTYEKYFYQLYFLFQLSLLFAQSKTENIIIVTLDGFRWEEVFGGADSLLINDSTYVHDTASLKQQFWTSSIEERRKTSSPFSGIRSNHRVSYTATGGRKIK